MNNTTKPIGIDACKGDSEYPLCIALNRLDELELMPKDADQGSGLVRKDDVIQLLEEFEVKLLDYNNKQHEFIDLQARTLSK